MEILSPLLKRPQENFKIAVSPRLYEQEGEKFTQIAVMREIIRYRQASQVKASLGLVTPALLLVSLVAVSYTHLDVYKRQARHRSWQQIFSTEVLC